MSELSCVSKTVNWERPDTERALLGCILEKQTLLDEADLQPEDFSLSWHACIFKHMLAMRGAGDSIDAITIAHCLESHGELEASGGQEYIGRLLDGGVQESFSTYIKIIREMACRRRLIRDLALTTGRAESQPIPAKEVLTELESVTAAYRDGVAAERKVRFRTAAELAAEVTEEPKWVACPLVAAGAITLAIGKVKSAGKTTFFTHLVKSVLDGTPFMGMSTTKGPVLYLSEQSDATLKVPLRRAGLLHRDDLAVATWAQMSRLGWPEVVYLARQKCKEIGAVLLVVDTIGQFTGLAGDAENNAGDALRAMQPLQQAATGGLGILVSQHERKSGGDVEDSGRGSSAFAGAVDIVLNIRRLPGNGNPNVRTIRALSRFDETPPEITIELTSEGYVICDAEAVASQQAQVLLSVAPDSQDKAVTVEKLCKMAGIRRTAGQDAISRLMDQGRLSRVGKGHKGSPHCFFKVAIHSAANIPY